MAKKELKFFYAGIVLAENRASVLFFDGVWTAFDDVPAAQVVQAIKAFESNNNGGVKVSLTAFNKL